MPSTLVKLYACDFYGSQLWDLYSYDVCKRYTSSNVAMRILFDVPRSSHRYLIGPISRTLHIKTLITSRFVSFYQRISNCDTFCIRLLTNLSEYDYSSVLCKNLNSIANDCKTSTDCYPKTV